MAKKKRKVSGSSHQSGQTSVRETSRLSSTAEFNPDYTNIKKDLKRILSLAISFFVILIALSFFLR